MNHPQNDPREVAASAGRETKTVCAGFTRGAPASSTEATPEARDWLDQAIAITSFPRKWITTGQVVETTWRELVALLGTPLEGYAEKSLVPLWSPATFDEGRRARDRVQRVDALTLDDDRAGASWEAAVAVWKRYAGALHTTWSDSLEKPARRAVLALSRPVDAGEFDRLWRAFARRLEGEGYALGREAKDPSRAWFRPALRPGGEFKFAILTGSPVDVDELLAEVVQPEAAPDREPKVAHIATKSEEGDTLPLIRERLRDRETVIALLGVVPVRSKPDWFLSLCPIHAETRPSFSMRFMDGRWLGYCFSSACNAGGDALALIALQRRITSFRAVLESVGASLGIEVDYRPPGGSRSGSTSRKRVPLDADEVAELWASCVPADQDDEVAAWVRSRGIDLAHLVDRDLARALPRDAKVPAWATYGRPWTGTGHRLLVPSYDASGQMASFLARAVVEHPAKAVWPTRPTPEALVAVGVFADPLGRLLLETGEAPDWWSGPLEVHLLEGIPDFLSVATMFGDDERAPAVLGFAAHGFTDQIAERIPDGSRVIFYEHADASGETYSARIQGTIGHRVDITIARMRLEDGN